MAHTRRAAVLLLAALVVSAGCSADTEEAPAPLATAAPLPGSPTTTPSPELAEGTVTPAGSYIEGPDGVTLIVPPGTVQEPTAAHVRELPDGYDVHIDGAWDGFVMVLMPIGDLPEDTEPVLLHHAAEGQVLEPAVVVGDHLVARLESLSVIELLKCSIPPTNALKCLAKDGYKELKKEALNQGGKKATDPLACGDVLDVVGWFTGEEACHAGETQEEIDAWQKAEEERRRKEQQGTPPSGAAPPAAAPVSEVRLSRGGAAPQGSYYDVRLAGFAPGTTVQVSCRDSADPGGFLTFTLATDAAGEAAASNRCYSGDGPDHWVVAGGRESNHVSWAASGGTGAAPPPPAPPPPAPPSRNPVVSLAQGPSAPAGYRYAVSLSGFSPGAAVTVTCHDSADPGGFFTFTMTTDGAGNAFTQNQCYSGDGPDHWVRAGGRESNHVAWSAAAPPPPPPAANPVVSLGRGPGAPAGYRYAVSLSGFSPGAAVTVTCHDSADPGGFFTFTMTTDGAGNAFTQNQCYSGDGPDHWVRAGGRESNHVTW
ncbi:hypothetical protein [Blastococcus sp. TF02-8]|uniref:hypothetical protein n=1 Tax=Blastococcus sp. TF02-8 TaxID=2250574 RepID=UPI0011BE1017|nr:hypothetical protein [Blastococcus sp. TF02-8]